MKIILITCLLVLTTESYPQDFKVNYYFGEKSAYNLTVLDSNVWIGGNMGVTKLNKFDFNNKELITDPFVNFEPNSCFQTMTYKNTDGELFFTTSDLYKYTNQNLIEMEDFDSGINDFCIDENNIIWLITANQEIVRIDNEGITYFNSTNSALPDYWYNCLSVYNNIIWLGTINNGIVKFNYVENEIIEFNCDNSPLPSPNISCIESISDTVWLSCNFYVSYPYYINYSNLVCFNGSDWDIYSSFNSDMPLTIINDLYYFNEKIYLSTNEGLLVYDNINWEIYDTTNSALITNIINSVTIDENNIWICTNEGVSLINEDSIYNIALHNMPFFYGIFQGPIAEDSVGNIWVGTSGTFGNLCKYDGVQWTEIIGKGTPSHDGSISALAVDTNNIIWATVYSFNGGIYRIEGDSIVKFDESNSVVESFCKDVIVDKQNNKWILSEGKLLKYNDITWTEFDSSDYPILTALKSIACDNEGNIWVGVGQTGMVKYDGVDWTHYDDSFFGNEYSEVNKIIVDDENNLWIDYSHGAGGEKVCKYNGDSLIWYDYHISLPSKGNGLMAVEDDGDFWYHSTSGLSKYNGLDWIDYKTSNTRLLNNQCWEFFIDSKNNKWISSDCYLAMFNEDSLYVNSINEGTINKNNTNFVIYPNPLTNGVITLKSDNNISEELFIQIFDMMGKLVYNEKILFKSEERLNLLNLHNGLYLLNINRKTKSETYKLLIEKN